LATPLEEADRLLGLEKIPVFPVTDSTTGLGSHVDRHERIGLGFIREDAFRRLLRDPRLDGKAFVLETPVEEEGDEARSVATLWRLAGVKEG
jgi:deoxyribonuclease-4